MERDLSLQNGAPDPTSTKAKILELSKNELIQLISHLEREVHNRDAVIHEMMNQQTKQALYQAKYGRFGVSDPFQALQRDSDDVVSDNFDHAQVKNAFDNQLQQLENLIETQRRAQGKMREQKLAADERYKKVCIELEEAKRKHAQDTAQGDDVTVALEKEREKLLQDLAYSKSQNKKLEKEMKKLKAELDNQTEISGKHKQIAIDLIKERRKMVSKVAESERHNQAIAQLLQKEKQDNKKSENSKLLQLEAKMEKQAMDFDIEREQLKVKLRKEELKVKDLVKQLTDIKETVLSLQRESVDSGGSPLPPNINASLAAYLPIDSTPQLTDTHIQPIQAVDTTTPVVMSKSITKVLEQNTEDSVPLTAKLTQGPALSPPPVRHSQTDQKTKFSQSSTQYSERPKTAPPPQPISPKPSPPVSSTAAARNTSSSPAAAPVKQVVVSGVSTTKSSKQITIVTSTNLSSSQNSISTSNNTSRLSRPSSSNNSDNRVTAAAQLVPTLSVQTQSFATSTTRVITRTPVTDSNLAKAAAEAALKRNSAQLEANTNGSGLTSPKSNVPPHLGSQALLGNKSTISTTASLVTVKSPDLHSSRTSVIGGNKGLGGKAKPPPPVRNVSLQKLVPSNTGST